MVRNTALFLSLGMLIGAGLSQAAEPARPPIRPSFDCAAAKTRWKVLVCGDEVLAALDLQEDQLLRRARAKAVAPDAVNAEQDLWLSERDSCASAGCLINAYRRRIRELHNWTN